VSEKDRADSNVVSFPAAATEERTPIRTIIVELNSLKRMAIAAGHRNVSYLIELALAEAEAAAARGGPPV
jgi:hypothetical protein